MKKPFSCLLEEEVIAEIKRRTSDSVSQAEVVKRAMCGEPVDGSMMARLERVEQALALASMDPQLPEPPSLEKPKEESGKEGILFKRIVSKVERDGLVEALRRMRGGEAQVNDPVEKQLANVDGRLEIVDRMVVHLIQSVDRMVSLMVEAQQRSAEGPPAEVDRKESTEQGDLTGQAPAPSGVKTIDPRSLGLTPEQVKSFGLKTGADLEPKVEEELPDDPQTPVPPDEEPAKPENQIRGVSKKEGGKVMGKVIDEIREDLLPRTIGIPVAHLLTKAEPKPVVPQFNQVQTIDRRGRQPLLRPNGRL